MSVKNGDGKFCIVMDADVSGSVEYLDKNVGHQMPNISALRMLVFMDSF